MQFRWNIGRSAVALAACLTVLTLGAGLNAALASTLTTVHSFCATESCSDGWHPTGPLLRDGAGHLFGTTEVGGTHNGGLLYRITHKKNGWQFKILYNFCKSGRCRKGANPHGGLIADTAGNLYGVMNSGEPPLAGGVFRVSSDGTNFAVLHSFCSEQNCQDGKGELDTGVALTYQGAASGAPYDGVSPLYGVTEEGGANNSGVIFSLTPPSDGQDWTYSVLYAFCPVAKCADGSEPDALIADASGNLYGTTVTGGGHNIDQDGKGGGTVFRFAGNAYQTLYAFCAKANCSDGEYAEALTMDAQGNLIGVTSNGGSANFGTIFKIGTDGVQHKLYDFCSQANCADGKTPTAAPFIDAAGNLFGVTYLGGANNGGVAYKFDGSLQVLYNFCSVGSTCTDGALLYSPMIPDGAGNFFGVTYGGNCVCALGLGTAFRLTP